MLTSRGAADSSSRALAGSLQKLIQHSLSRRFPPVVARSGDSVGLTISTLRDVERGGAAVVLLCVDLTEQVLAEAINSHTNHIITFFPTPSRPLHVLSSDEIASRIVLRCASSFIGVHSISSACANAQGGMLDWVATSLASGSVTPILPHPEVEGAGEGRMLEAERALPLANLVLNLKDLLLVKHVRLALGVSVEESNLAKAQECCFVKSIAIHTGDASVLARTSANVFITSEMAHADVLAANAQGVVVILTGQTTMERAYLRSLQQELHTEFARSDWNVKVRCSEVDNSPLAVV